MTLSRTDITSWIIGSPKPENMLRSKATES
ncbi:Uncharacterised protein [Rothia dentocariosa]|nr:Uncharacterised protein [Rothia dentocariosa]